MVQHPAPLTIKLLECSRTMRVRSGKVNATLQLARVTHVLFKIRNSDKQQLQKLRLYRSSTPRCLFRVSPAHIYVNQRMAISGC